MGRATKEKFRIANQSPSSLLNLGASLRVFRFGLVHQLHIHGHVASMVVGPAVRSIVRSGYWPGLVLVVASFPSVHY